MNIIGIYGSIGWNVLDAIEVGVDKVNEHWLHNSGATLFVNGNHVCSIEEERLSRIKYDGNFPKKSIEYCLSVGNICKDDIELVMISSMSNIIFYEHLTNGIIESKIKEFFPNAKIKIISHHMCHAYASVFSCDYNEGTFITMDGSGSTLLDPYGIPVMTENNSIGYFNKSKGNFKFFPGIPTNNNFGFYYWVWSHYIYTQKTKKNINIYDPKYRESYCGKIMGLSAYGDTDKFPKDYVTRQESYPVVVFKSIPPDENSTPYPYENSTPENQAKILQYNFEEGMLEYLRRLKKESYITDDNLCLSGGVFLNILTNSKIYKEEICKNIHIPPFTDDSGLSFGAACYGVFNSKEKITIPENISILGKKYSECEIIEELKKNKNIEYKKYKNFEDLCEDTAKLLSKNKIIGWFQNRSEFGPRALGSRSILMNPGPKENKDILNNQIKHRENWRPFAGVMLEEYQSEYFLEDYSNEYMLYSLTVKPHQREKLGAITHVDFTCRIQTVNKNFHPEITTLLTKYNDITGCPILLNTSLNDNGQPIVESPKDAIDTFCKINLDYLIIGNYFVTKKNLITEKNSITYI